MEFCLGICLCSSIILTFAFWNFVSVLLFSEFILRSRPEELREEKPAPCHDGPWPLLQKSPAITTEEPCLCVSGARGR
jgi:hypothetical protein